MSSLPIEPQASTNAVTCILSGLEPRWATPAPHGETSWLWQDRSKSMLSRDLFTQLCSILCSWYRHSLKARPHNPSSCLIGQSSEAESTTIPRAPARAQECKLQGNCSIFRVHSATWGERFWLLHGATLELVRERHNIRRAPPSTASTSRPRRLCHPGQRHPLLEQHACLDTTTCCVASLFHTVAVVHAAPLQHALIWMAQMRQCCQWLAGCSPQQADVLGPTLCCS